MKDKIILNPMKIRNRTGGPFMWNNSDLRNLLIEGLIRIYNGPYEAGAY